MIQFQQHNGHDLTYCKAMAFGMETYQVDSGISWVRKFKRKAAANLMIKRLLGICAQRRVAYSKKDYRDKWETLCDLERFLQLAKGHHSAKHMFNVILAQEHRIRCILPTKGGESMVQDVEDMLAWIKKGKGEEL